MTAAELLGLPLGEEELGPCWACCGCSCDNRPGAAAAAPALRSRAVTFDRWNSANSIQRLFLVGIFSHDYSFSTKQQLAIYRNLKALIHNAMLSLPDEPKLLHELNLLKLKNGTTTSPARFWPTR